MTPRQSERDENTIDMFGDPSIEEIEARTKAISFRGLQRPIWTENKAKLIQSYLRYFVFITKHGTYIDGFAGPQEIDLHEAWSAKLVVETEPRWLRHFYLCELDKEKIPMLQRMVSEQSPRRKGESKRELNIIEGDFNKKIDEILLSPHLDEAEATFALLDQRTFECHWETVKKLAAHKKGSKIELFYFLAVKWLHRSLAGTGDIGAEKVTQWWGNEAWAQLAGMSQQQIADTMKERFLKELGYKYAFCWPIFERESAGGSVMYYMIHATDHDEAPKLMYRAYNNAVAKLKPQQQLDWISS